MSIDSYVAAFVMAGGRGTRLHILTRDRSKPAVNIIGHYRIFDFVATNIANTGIPAMLIATQFRPRSLSTHIGNGQVWGFDGIDKKIEIVHPYEDYGDFVTFDGTADCVRKSVNRISRYNPEVVLVLAGDHIYAMNYSSMIKQHIASDADITIMTNPIPDDRVSDLGIVRIDESGRIVDFAEKPKDAEVMEKFRLSDTMKKRLGIDNPELNFLASMGNYVFFWHKLKEFLNLSGDDFAKDIIPSIRWNEGSLYAYVFKGYWRDVGKIKDYFNCNMEFACGSAPIDLFKHRIRKHERHLPGPSIAANTAIQSTVLSSGNVIQRGAVITNSVLGYQVVIEEDCVLGHCVLLGADRNEFHDNEIREQYTTRIGKGSNLSYVILDKNVWIGEGINIGPHNGSYEIRRKILQDIGLKPYREIADGTIEGDFYIEPGTGILVIGKQNESDPKEPMLPDGLRC